MICCSMDLCWVSTLQLSDLVVPIKTLTLCLKVNYECLPAI